jgi:hypothetical protein
MTDAADSPVPLAPGRSCGTCIACCITPAIVSAEYDKPADTRCQYCDGKGCTIYATRFSPCRSFFCGWRQDASLSEDWRPDRSGVILFSRAVEGYASPQGIDLMLTEGEASIRRPWFAPFVADLVRRRLAVFMTINGRVALINPALEPVLTRGNQAVLAQLLRLHAGAYSGSPKL